MRYHKKGYPLVRRSVGDLWHWGQHMAYLSLTGNDCRGPSSCWRRTCRTSNPHMTRSAASRSFAAPLIVVEGLAASKDRMKLRLPADSPWVNGSGEYVLADLAGKVRARALEVSRRFDRRNGNPYYEELVDQASKLRKKATRVPYVG